VVTICGTCNVIYHDKHFILTAAAATTITTSSHYHCYCCWFMGYL